MDDKTILVVDDEADNITYLQTILRREGYRVLTARNGVEGVNRALTELPDLVVLDVQMPELNGFEVFTRLRSEVTTKEIPIVMLTGIREKIGRGYSGEDMQTFFGKKPAGYLEKPVSPEALLKVVRESL